jgi:methylmalonyl-CoA carboxyltransferase large subunit
VLGCALSCAPHHVPRRAALAQHRCAARFTEICMADDRETDAGADTIAALRAELARLAARLAALEAAEAGVVAVAGGGTGAGMDPRVAAAVGRMAAAATPQTEAAIPEETLIVIAAAVAAYLGSKPRIRQVTLLGSTAWAQQGRATIQASHMLPLHHPQGRP